MDFSPLGTDTPTTSIVIANGNLVLAALVVLFIGREINRRIDWLEQHNIPMAVTGGLLCSIITTVIYFTANIEIDFNMSLRDILLLAFFSTVGMSA